MADHETVSLSLTIVQAFQPSNKPLPFYETTRNNRRKRIYEAVKPRNYYHVEYQLQPGLASPIYCTDVVTYGIVAKIFTDQDERVVKSWTENGLVHYGWSHYHKFELNLDSLLELYDHTLTIRLWNTPDKVSAKARYDRPKAFRLPVPKTQEQESGESTNESLRPLHFPGVYHSLSSMSVKHTRRRSRRPSELIECVGSTEEYSDHSISNQKSQRISPLVEDPISVDSSLKTIPHTDSFQVTAQSVSHTTLSDSVSPGLKGISKHRMKLLQEEAHEKERINKEGLVSLSIKFSDLFAGKKNTTCCMQSVVAELNHFEVTLSLETALMSEQQKAILNPMSITIRDCTLPPSNSQHHERIIHASYQFLNNPKTCTPARPYSSLISWDSSSVLLLGIIEPELLLEYLRGPPLTLEIHDRHKKSNDDRLPVEGAVFGQLPRDQLLGTHGQTNKSVGTVHSDTLIAEAKLDLSNFLSGLTTMEFFLPLLKPKSLQNALSKDLSIVSKDYLHHDSHLTVTIRLTRQLIFLPLQASRGDLLSQRPLTPFGRLVYIVSSGSADLVQKLIGLINEINAFGLNLKEPLPVDQKQALLSTYKLTQEQMSSPKCDVITGFHIEDTEKHIFVLEGLHWKGLGRLWKELPHQSTEENIKCFYDSDYTFSRRKYGSLDVDLIHIVIPQAMKIIVQEPRLYLYSAGAKPCFLTLLNLHELQFVQDFSCIIRNDMLPSVDMINNLSVFCSSQLVTSKLDEPTVVTQTPVQLNARKMWRRTRSLEPLNNINSKYEELLLERQQMPKCDRITNNILKVKQLSEKVKGIKRLHKRSTSEGDKPIALYSTQMFNSTMVNKAALRKQLDPRSRYTYCQDYHFMTVEPVDGEEELKLYWKRDDKRKWMTNEGFILTSTKANRSVIYPKEVDQARKEELEQAFKDNLLHANTLKPTVDWDTIKWEERLNDFDRYRQPPIDFGTQYPATIHLAGHSRKEEINHFEINEQERWKASVVVDDLRFHTLRQGLRTELGRKAASQQEKLKGLLKDHPKIPSSIAPSEHLRVDTLPALSLVRDNEKEVGLVGYTPGDVSTNTSLRRNCNVIPIHKLPIH